MKIKIKITKNEISRFILKARIDFVFRQHISKQRPLFKIESYQFEYGSLLTDDDDNEINSGF